jgi:hypothetical protein
VGMYKELFVADCEWCDAEFISRTHNHIYCSVKCRNKHASYQRWFSKEVARERAEDLKHERDDPYAEAIARYLRRE